MYIRFAVAEFKFRKEKKKSINLRKVISAEYMMPAESQNGITDVQLCYVENQKGAIVIDFVQQ